MIEDNNVSPDMDGEDNEEVASTESTEIVLPFDPSTVADFTEMAVIRDRGINRRQRLFTIIEEGVTLEWGALRDYLVQDKSIAGSAQYAHAMFAGHLFSIYKEKFLEIGKITLRPVTHKELWDLCAETLKNRGLVFERGYVTGLKSILKPKAPEVPEPQDPEV